MSINTAHANNGVLFHSGESILLFSDNVTIEFAGQESQLFKGSKKGRIYLTTHRMIFNNKNSSEPLQSFSFPFISLSDVDIEQPTFSANYIKGKVRAQPNGNWFGEAKFKLYFNSGGAIDFGQALLHAAKVAMRYGGANQQPPPYTPPSGAWYEAPPPAYQPNPDGYYGWIPNRQSFPNGPPPNTVFMTDNPPPYPGLVPNSTNNFGDNRQPAYNPGVGQQNQQGYPGGQNNFSNSGPSGNYPQPAGAMGFNAFPQTNTKEGGIAQSAFFDPNNPQTAYVPPPSYYEPPPCYNSVNKKND